MFRHKQTRKPAKRLVDILYEYGYRSETDYQLASITQFFKSYHSNTERARVLKKSEHERPYTN